MLGILARNGDIEDCSSDVSDGNEEQITRNWRRVHPHY
jgi:hypothetical protein